VRREANFFNGDELTLVYIAKRLKEALALEDLLTERAIDYYVEPDTYTGGVIFRRTRVGAFFYVRASPKYENIAIFNGFGSRGSLMIPWYSQSFSQTLINHTPIPKEASIQRFKDLLG